MNVVSALAASCCLRNVFSFDRYCKDSFQAGCW